jgi:hypothetical protein
MGDFHFPEEPPAAESELTLAARDVAEQHSAGEHHKAALQKHIMGLIEACRVRLPGVDAPGG